MKIDIHNHTTRCNHAEGTVDEYIQRAIELGIEIYGFSEHGAMDFDLKYRLGFDEMADYENEIRQARDKYAEDIEIIVGYEVDWLPKHMDDRILNANVDYLIGSVHFLDKWGFDNPEFLSGWKNRNIDEIWKAYFEATNSMIRSGYFDIVGHLDLIKVFKYMPKTDIRILAKETLRAIKLSNMVLEINTAGLRKPVKELYPSASLLEEAYELDIPITFSSDAHSVEQVGLNLDLAYKAAKEIGYSQAVTFRNRDRELIKI